jgi:hypothetical protein
MRVLNAEELLQVSGGEEVAPVTVVAPGSDWYTLTDPMAIMNFNNQMNAQQDLLSTWKLQHKNISRQPPIDLYGVEVTDTTNNVSYFIGIDSNAVTFNEGKIQFHMPQSAGVIVTIRF